jgi:pimeloyl-ACP methyl ester carboxylesterase
LPRDTEGGIFSEQLEKWNKNLKKHIYLISGLGTDERIFQNLDFSGYEPHFIQWIPPLSNESLKSYAARLSAQITRPKPYILGVSFGGMLAVEISKIIDCQRVIIISSAKNHREIPFLYRLVGYLHLQPFIPFQLLRRMPYLPHWTFGMKTASQKLLLNSILSEIDPNFLKWAIHAILTWKNEVKNQNCVHIHGTKDRVLPLMRRMNVNFEVENGEHLMVYTQAEAINQILKYAV